MLSVWSEGRNTFYGLCYEDRAQADTGCVFPLSWWWVVSRQERTALAWLTTSRRTQSCSTFYDFILFAFLTEGNADTDVGWRPRTRPGSLSYLVTWRCGRQRPRISVPRMRFDLCEKMMNVCISGTRSESWPADQHWPHSSRRSCLWTDCVWRWRILSWPDWDLGRDQSGGLASADIWECSSRTLRQPTWACICHRSLRRTYHWSCHRRKDGFWGRGDCCSGRRDCHSPGLESHLGLSPPATPGREISLSRLQAEAARWFSSELPGPGLSQQPLSPSSHSARISSSSLAESRLCWTFSWWKCWVLSWENSSYLSSGPG